MTVFLIKIKKENNNQKIIEEKKQRKDNPQSIIMNVPNENVSNTNDPKNKTLFEQQHKNITTESCNIYKNDMDGMNLGLNKKN